MSHASPPVSINKHRYLLEYLAGFVLMVLMCFNSIESVANQTKANGMIIEGIGKIYQVKTPEGMIYISGAPEKEALVELKKLGVKMVVDFRMPNEHAFDAQQELQSMQIGYQNIPFNAKNMDDKNLEAFSAIVKNPQHYPLYLHCATGNRAAVMLALHRIENDKLSVQEAIEKAKAFGLNNPNAQQMIHQATQPK